MLKKGVVILKDVYVYQVSNHIGTEISKLNLYFTKSIIRYFFDNPNEHSLISVVTPYSYMIRDHHNQGSSLANKLLRLNLAKFNLCLTCDLKC